ncbi:hypothetical protein [Nocardiopsis sp. NPDC057823]|uniref:hypothetical protein n=1 Tax=Nocardiopsis sp. NPDC057823 TaxID=3346256 RepID=UPI00366EBB38
MTEDRHAPGPDGLDGVDEVPWGDLEHAYGSAENVPGLLAAAFTAEEAPAREAVTALLSAVHHQGGRILPVAVPLLPFLIRLAADRGRPTAVREASTTLMTELAHCGCGVEQRFVAPGWREALVAAVPELIALLEDPEPLLRSGAASVLAWCPVAGSGSAAALRRRWEREPDEQVRLVLLESAARLSARRSDPAAPGTATGEDVEWLLYLREHGDVDERMILGLADPLLLPDDPAGLFVEAVERDGRPPWQRAAFRACSRGHFTDEQYRRSSLLRASHVLANRPGVRAELALRLLGSPYAGARLGAVDTVTGLVAEFRGAEAEWADTAGGLLEETVTEARTIAAQVLSVAGEAAVPWADALAERAARAEDTAERASALFALSRLRDFRAVSLVLEGSGEPGFGLAWSRGPGGWSSAPGLPDVLEAFAHEAGPLTPWLRERLRRDDDAVLGVLRLLERWGAAAAPFTDEVAAHLDAGPRSRAAMNVLAAVGRPASRQAEAVRRSAGSVNAGAAALAYWRLTGDGEGAMGLVGGFRRRQWAPVWTLLAEIGPAAVRFVDTVRSEVGRPGGDPRAVLALWRTTGDTDTALSLLLDGETAPLTVLTAFWQGREAVRALGEMGAAAAPALPLLRGLRAAPRRPWRQGWPGSGWRDVLHDRELLGLLDETITHIEG